MGLFTKRKRRSTRKAEAKALKHKAKIEAKLGARTDRKRLRADKRSQKKIEKAQVSAFKAQEKVAEKQAAKLEKDPFSVASVKKYLGVARVLAPVLAPLAYRGATFARGQLEARRAQQLGVGVEQLGQFTGHGAKLSARIASAETSLTEISALHAKDAETGKFIEATRERLTDLAPAIHAAELMPAPRRRAAHLAISNELSGIEADLLARLGVR
ncbi:hypothetical protein JGU71_13110 [Antrihabitans sp. YC3-6]|uniref:Uncharacterized protein n=1 Tax=Antrihabitans stalagmiti TaxID=2799499 RepID=A0A934U4H9_9NOCA|nr:DUF6474 family protein [Antrihabitans stalagmiti]MBJ8339828.1 hypothetical protein [Antrihabitans stalagmiti]